MFFVLYIQILFKYPPGKRLAVRPKDLAAFCFPGGVKVHFVDVFKCHPCFILLQILSFFIVTFRRLRSSYELILPSGSSQDAFGYVHVYTYNI